MRLSNSEENHINNANARLRGIVFSSQSICENGNFETAGVVQTVSISNHVNNTTYPHRKCYDIKIERSYSNISPYQTQYSFRVYVNEEEVITELTPLYVVEVCDRYQRRKAATKVDYIDAVYKLFLGTDSLNLF